MNEYKMTAALIRKAALCLIVICTICVIRNYIDYEITTKLAMQQMSLNGGTIYYDMYTKYVDIGSVFFIGVFIAFFARTIYNYFKFRKELKK